MSNSRLLSAILSRRALLVALLNAAMLAASKSRAQVATGQDRGIGGTGVARPEPGDGEGRDRGVGGTGVVGTIRGFGSIVVNDLHVSFPPEVRVTIDGRAATPADLLVGQVVEVLARQRRKGLVTRAIDVRSEVIGPVEAVAANGFTVLGQNIVMEQGAVPVERTPGENVAVSGLRRLDGVVVASLVEQRMESTLQVRGPVQSADGVLTIGTLRVAGLEPALVGRRVSLVGTMHAGVFQPTAIDIEPVVPFARAERLSIEAYVAPTSDGLRLGSGVALALTAFSNTIAAREPVRAVVTATVAANGQISLTSLKVAHEERGLGGEDGRRAPAPADRVGEVGSQGRRSNSRPGGASRSGRGTRSATPR